MTMFIIIPASSIPYGSGPWHLHGSDYDRGDDVPLPADGKVGDGGGFFKGTPFVWGNM